MGLMGMRAIRSASFESKREFTSVRVAIFMLYGMLYSSNTFCRTLTFNPSILPDSSRYSKG